MRKTTERFIAGMLALVLPAFCTGCAAPGVDGKNAGESIAALFDGIPRNHPIPVSVGESGNVEYIVFTNENHLSDKYSSWTNDGDYVNPPDDEDGQASRLFSLHFYEHSASLEEENATIVGILVSARRDEKTAAYKIDEVRAELIQENIVPIAEIQTSMYGRIAVVTLYQNDELLQTVYYRVDDDGGIAHYPWPVFQFNSGAWLEQPLQEG